mmetsp:Transcript_5897/g.11986  ORF Transcript_5897/g.11986 Transcript_5897/m.11986 type:complete len:483 (-) Transcript_5897:214-1662(-)
MHKDLEEGIEREHKRFRLDYEDRLQKFLHRRAAVYKEKATDALLPHLTRLHVQYDQELGIVDDKLQAEESSVKTSQLWLFKSRLQDQHRAVKKNLEKALRMVDGDFSNELDRIIWEYKNLINEKKDFCECEIENYRRIQNGNAQRGKNINITELGKVQSRGQERLKQLQESQSAHIYTVLNNFEGEVQHVWSNVDRQQNYCIEMDRTDQNNNENKFKRAVAQSEFALIDEDVDSSVKVDYSHDQSFIKADLELGELMLQATEGRDKQVQNYIRIVEHETLRLDRKWWTRNEQIKERGLSITVAQSNYDTHHSVISHISGSKYQNKLISGRVVNRENLQSQFPDLRKCTDQIISVEVETMEKVDLLKGSLSARCLQVHEKQEQHHANMSLLQLEGAVRVRELRCLCKTQKSKIDQILGQNSAEILYLESSRISLLGGLNKEVKSEVVRREQSLSHLREVEGAEKAIHARLTKLIQQYKNLSYG